MINNEERGENTTFFELTPDPPIIDSNGERAFIIASRPSSNVFTFSLTQSLPDSIAPRAET